MSRYCNKGIEVLHVEKTLKATIQKNLTKFVVDFRYSQPNLLWFTVFLFHSNLDENVTSNEQKVTSNEQKVLPPRIIYRVFDTNSSFHVVHYGKSSISVFQEIFTSADKIFISVGGLSTMQ